MNIMVEVNFPLELIMTKDIFYNFRQALLYVSTKR